MEPIYSLTDLARRTREIVDHVLASGCPATVAGRGKPEMVILPRDEYLGMLHALDEMSRPDWRETWEQANAEAESGELIPWEEVKTRKRL